VTWQKNKPLPGCEVQEKRVSARQGQPPARRTEARSSSRRPYTRLLRRIKPSPGPDYPPVRVITDGSAERQSEPDCSNLSRCPTQAGQCWNCGKAALMPSLPPSSLLAQFGPLGREPLRREDVERRLLARAGLVRRGRRRRSPTPPPHIGQHVLQLGLGAVAIPAVSLAAKRHIAALAVSGEAECVPRRSWS
jgi:hypothetical protein